MDGWVLKVGERILGEFEVARGVWQRGEFPGIWWLGRGYGGVAVVFDPAATTEVKFQIRSSLSSSSQVHIPVNNTTIKWPPQQ